MALPKETEIHSIKTDIALMKQNQEMMKKDINQIGEIFIKVENTISKLTDAIKTIAVQEKVMENSERRIGILENNSNKQSVDTSDLKEDLRLMIDKFREENKAERDANNRHIMDRLDELNIKLGNTFDEHEKRIKSLEGWKLYLAGAGALMVALINLIPWDKFF